MFVNFMDLLRKIKIDIYPDIATKYNAILGIKSEIDTIKLDTFNYEKEAEASALNAKSYATKTGGYVSNVQWDNSLQRFIDTGTNDFSAKYWALYNENTRGSFIDMMHQTEALKQTAESLLNEPMGEERKEYTWNVGSQSFDQSSVAHEYSIMNYYNQIKQTQYRNREKEIITNQVQGQNVFTFSFSLTENTDIYVNGILRVPAIDYFVSIADDHEITFMDNLNMNDVIIAIRTDAVLMPLELYGANVREPVINQKTFSATNGQTEFVINNKSISGLVVYIDGLMKSTSQYDVTYPGSNTVVTLFAPADELAKIDIVYVDVI